MNEADEAIYQAIRGAERIRSATRRRSSPQVRGSERDLIRETALTWFQSYRPKLEAIFSQAELQQVDEMYQDIVEASHKNAGRSGYVSTFKDIGDSLVQLRSSNMRKLSAASTTDAPPDFSRLISDGAMQKILEKRWTECVVCIHYGAPLAATVMVGGLLEGLLLARVNRETNKRPIFTAAAAPKDRQGQPLTLRDWTLQDYIGVAHELGWITVAAKDVGVVLRDYRNYIHPQKELSHGVSLTTPDAAILWEIGKSISRQLLR
ncbi:MAG: hypothetical protein WA857_21920 [Candidatus Acidiferrum sp.]|jgi:hypothetical protein